jgi:hypothetical protein
MKKLFFLATMFCCTSVFAQDIILKTDGTEIKAKVMKISNDEIEYKKFENLLGPNYVVSTSEVFMITYENGLKEVISKQQKSNEVQPVLPLKEEKMTGEEKETKNEFYRIGNNDKEMLEFLKKHDTDSYKAFESACKQRRNGKSLLATGIIFSIVGITSEFVFVGDARVIFSSILLVSGEVLIIASIPVSASAGGRKKSIKNNFEQKYFYTKNNSFQPNISLGLASNGISLKINF